MIRVLSFALAALLAGAAAQPAAAQDAEMVVRGTVLGPQGEPLSDLRVVLHRVQSGEGATIAETQSGGDGRFELRAPASADTTAIYFIAARWDGELYIGQAFRGEMFGDQVIQVGVPGTSASAMLGGGQTVPQPVGRPATTRNWLLLLIPLVGVAGVIVYLLVPRSRIPAERALLIRIAEIDERIDRAPPGQRESLLETRTRLMAELRAD